MTTTKQRLLDAAERVIRTKGLAAASTREIAREAGCADGTLYNHFSDRADLFAIINRSNTFSFPIPGSLNRSASNSWSFRYK
jgi:AcrR family transcriptional regulator